jgi:hypothetical protein
MAIPRNTLFNRAEAIVSAVRSRMGMSQHHRLKQQITVSTY